MKNNFTHKIAMCGATGFIGSHLRRHLEEAGHHVVPLGRELFTGEIQRLLNLMDGCDTVINVAGLTIDHRWSPAYKRQLYDSRVGTTRQIVEAIARTSSVRCWICASAVGYYPSAGCHDDRVPQPSGSDFLAGLCRDWEAEARKAPDTVRTIVTRFGVVLAPQGGAFERMRRPFRYLMALVPGNGAQSFSWIDIEDLCRAMLLLIETPQLDGTFNLAAPEPHTMDATFADLRLHYGRSLLIHIPAWLLRLLRGEAADALLKGQCAIPGRLLESGFRFRSSSLRHFLKRLDDRPER